MLTATDVSTILTDRKFDRYLPFAAFIAQCVNVYIAHGADEFDFQTLYVGDVAYLALKAIDATPDTYEHAFAVALFYVGKSYGWSYHPAAERAVRTTIPIPVLAQQVIPSAPPPPPQQPVDPELAEHRNRLAAMRRVTGVRVRGTALATAALALDGCFKWVRSGPVVPNQPGHVVGPRFGVKVEWDHTRTDYTHQPWEDHEIIRNDFAAWIHGGPLPSPHAAMNCWEAVMFAANRAGLVSREELQTMYRKAALAYEYRYGWVKDKNKPATSRHYGQALSQAFQFYSSVPFAPNDGLIPQRGDILFWDRDQHVAISLGRIYDPGGQPHDWIMSHWSQPQNGFWRMRIDGLPAYMHTNFRFRPCPF